VPLTASADGTHEGYTYTLADNKATITGYTGADATTITELDIPSSVTENGTSYPVTAIGGSGFATNVKVTTIKIPKTVETAALGVNNVPVSLQAFIVDALNPAYSSEEGVLFNKDKTILLACPQSKAGVYEVPEGVTTLAGTSIHRCKLLTGIKIPSSVKTIEGWALASSGFTSVDIPDSVTTIGARLFSGCASLTSFTLPESVTSIDSAGMFAGCTALTSITIPNIVTEIGARMFESCNGLTSITIPNHVTSIGEFAFMNCTNANLTSIEIPESVTHLDTGIIANDSQLTSITVKAANPTVTGTPFSNSTAKIWCYDSATLVKNSYNISARIIIMIDEPVLNITSPITLDLDGSDPTNDDKALLSVTGYEPAAQTETASDKGNSTPTLKGWTSSNDAAATVNATGSVLAKNPGTALITATINAHGGEKMASVPVTVLPATGAATKVLTVTNGTFAGTGSGAANNEFANGATVTIVAKDAPGGQVFDKWEITSSTGGSFVGETSPTAVFTMPDAAATVRATYKTLYTATVKNGTGAGSYAAGATVDISANAAPSGQVFDKWTSNDSVIFDNATSVDTTFTMPDNPVTVTANYKEESVTPPPPTTDTFSVTVTGGTDGANGTYAAGATVNITANAPASGKVFDTWTTSDGVTFASATSSTTSFVMPAKAVTVTATYKDEPVDPPVNPPAKAGWVYESGVWKFFKDGAAVTGWIHDGKAWYYLDSAGEMQTGWIYDQNKWYYLAGNGAMKTSWVKDAGSWYYLSGNGAMIASRWFKDTDGSWYYLSGNGKMLTGKQNIGGKAYTFKLNGAWVG
jgi:hypothetical protein